MFVCTVIHKRIKRKRYMLYYVCGILLSFITMKYIYILTEIFYVILFMSITVGKFQITNLTRSEGEEDLSEFITLLTIIVIRAVLQTLSVYSTVNTH